MDRCQRTTRSSEKKAPVENFKSIPGEGAEGRVEGREVKAVSPGFLRGQNIALTDQRIEPLQAQGKTVVLSCCQVYSWTQVEQLVELYLTGASRDRLDPILDALRRWL